MRGNSRKNRIKSRFDNILTWANQIRLLKLNFQSLSGVIGQGLIAGILPAIKALNAFMAKLMEAAKVFRNFMYTLMGKKVQTVTAGIVNDLNGIGDASDSLENLGDSAEEAGKKLKNKLFTLPFDELNILSEESDDLSDAIGDIGDIGFDDDFLDTDSEMPINEWAKRIRDAFLSQDWERLGATIAELLNKGLQKIYDIINWDNVGAKITEFVDAITRTFNSLVDVFDWDLLGRTIGAGINTLVNTFNMLLEGIDFENLGRKLSEGLRGMIAEVDWQNLGNLLGNYFMVAWRLFEGFLDGMWKENSLTGLNGFQELGISLAEGIYGIFEKIDLGRIGAAISSIFNGIFETMQSFVNEMESKGTWQKIADNISRGLNNAISGIKPVEAALALGQFVTDLLGTMLSVAERTPWNELGHKIGQFLINIPWSTIFWQVFDIITNVLGGLFGGLATEILYNFDKIGTALADGFNEAFQRLKAFTLSVDWNSIAENIYIGLNNMIHGINWAAAGKTLSDFVVKLLRVFWDVAQKTDWKALGKGIGDFLSNIDWATILGGVFEIIWNVLSGLISGLLDTKSGKVIVAVAAGIAVLEVLFKGAKIIKSATELFGGLSGVFSLIGGLFSPTGLLITAIAAGVVLIIANWDKIKEAAGKLKDWIGEKFSAIKETLHNAWEGVKEKATEVWDNISGYLSEKWEGIKSAASNIWGGIKTFFGGVWDGIKETASSIWDSTSTYLKDKWEDIKVGAKEKFEKVKEHISDTWDKIKEKTSNIWDGIKKSVGDVWEKLKIGAKDKFETIKGHVADAWDATKEKTSEIWGNIKGFLGNNWDNIKSWTSEKFGKVEKDISDTWSKVEKKTSDTWDDIKKTAGEKIPGIIGDISNKFSELPKTMDKTGKNAIDSLGKGMESQKGVISGKAKEVADTMDKELTGLNFEKIGGDMMNKLSDGIGKSKNVLQKAASGISDIFSGVVSSIGNAMDRVNSTIGNLRSGTSTRSSYSYSTPRFATGGFPEDGLFFANHNELVGQFTNGQTAVANNAQIVEGIKYGVREAVAEVLAPYLADIAQNTRETADKDMSVRIGDRDIVSAYNRGSARQGYSFTS